MAQRQTFLVRNRSVQSLFTCLFIAVSALACSWISRDTNVHLVSQENDSNSTTSDGCRESSQDRSRAKVIGSVVGVSDGDTVTVKDGNAARHTIRFFAIDAPENGQDFGKVSKTNLSSLISNKTVCVMVIEKDQYGREVGIVYSDGEDVNLSQVASGMAWHYKAHQHQQTGTDRWTYDRAETQARSEKRGLWRQADVVPPWEYRRMHQRRN